MTSATTTTKEYDGETPAALANVDTNNNKNVAFVGWKGSYADVLRHHELFPLLPVVGATVELDTDSGVKTVTVQAAKGPSGKALSSPIHRVAVKFSPEVHLQGSAKNMMCCVEVKKMDGTMGFCGHVFHLTTGEGTGNALKRGAHFSRCHPPIFSALKGSTSRSNDARDVAASAIANHEATTTAYDHAAAVKDFTIWCCADLRPFNTVSGLGFKLFMSNFADSDRWVVTTPSQATVDKCLEQVSVELREGITRAYVDGRKYWDYGRGVGSVTCDLWTSRTLESYFTVTLRHTVWELQGNGVRVLVSRRRHLCTRPMPPGHHRAKDIHDAIKAMLAERFADIPAGSETHPTFATGCADGALKERNALDMLHAEVEICKAHMLQTKIAWALGISGDRRDLKENVLMYDLLNGICKDIVATFRQSSLANDELHRLSEDSLSIITRNETRWSSTHEMIKRLLVLHSSIVQYFVLHRPDNPVLTSTWNAMRQLEAVLEPYARVTSMLQGGEYSYVSAAFTLFARLRPHLHAEHLEVRVLGKPAAEAVEYEVVAVKDFEPAVQKVVEIMKKRWEDFEVPKDEHTRTELLGCVLDPRFNWSSIDGGDSLKARALELLATEFELANSYSKQAMESQRRGGGSQPSAPASPSPVRKRVKLTADSISTGASDEQAANEMSEWRALLENPKKNRMAYGAIGTEGSLLRMWSQLSSKFPVLILVANAYCLTPDITTCESERRFSTAGLTITPLRSLLKPEKVENMLLVHANLHDIPNVSKLHNALEEKRNRSIDSREANEAHARS